MNLNSLPTAFALVARRHSQLPSANHTARFHAHSYLFETLLKSCTAALLGSILEREPDTAHRLGHLLLQADSLGAWHQTTHQCTQPPISTLIPLEFRPLLRWLTEKRTRASNNDFADSWICARDVLTRYTVMQDLNDSRLTVLHLLSAMVQIRNKVRGHGALGDGDYEDISPPYYTVLSLLLNTCPLSRWQWMFRRCAASHDRWVLLRGFVPKALDDVAFHTESRLPGIYLRPGAATVFRLPDLIVAHSECHDFYYANGSLTSRDGTAEFLSYSTASVHRLSAREFSRPVCPLPKSETHGVRKLDVHSNAFGNLPQHLSHYVPRPAPEQRLLQRLTDRNHPIITLHGRGGIGKTSLALHVAHQLAAEYTPPFDQIVWMSARDVDLKTKGAISVSQDVLTLDDIVNALCVMFSLDATAENLALSLEMSYGKSDRGKLFILDNFEILSDVVDVHEFVDQHCHLPNKVLITSRERAFKADFPIEIKGMERSEAERLIKLSARRLDIEKSIDPGIIRKMYQFTDGHPYLLKILVGEIARTGELPPLVRVFADRDDIADALFERSFNALSDHGRNVFLSSSTWNSLVPEFLLLAILGQGGVDAVRGSEECTRQALVETYIGHEDLRYVSVPTIARLYGRKKLRGEPDRMLIEADARLINQFGRIGKEEIARLRTAQVAEQICKKLIDYAARMEQEERDKVDGLLESVAETWSYGWSMLARFRRRFDREGVAYAYRRAVEENPFDETVLRERARFASETGDALTEVATLNELIDVCPKDVHLLSEVASKLADFLTAHKQRIRPDQRVAFAEHVIDKLQGVFDELDATGLSRLAWLYLLQGRKEEAEEAATAGYRRDRTNEHCRKSIHRLAS